MQLEISKQILASSITLFCVLKIIFNREIVNMNGNHKVAPGIMTKPIVLIDTLELIKKKY